MHNNHIYNLISQLTQEHRSLWRINKYYLKDVKNCKQCKDFWRRLKNEKEKQVKELMALLKSHKV